MPILVKNSSSCSVRFSEPILKKLIFKEKKRKRENLVITLNINRWSHRRLKFLREICFIPHSHQSLLLKAAECVFEGCCWHCSGNCVTRSEQSCWRKYRNTQETLPGSLFIQCHHSANCCYGGGGYLGHIGGNLWGFVQGHPQGTNNMYFYVF